VAYPISQGRLVYVIPFLSEPEKEGTYYEGPAVVEVSDDNFAPLFADWEEEVQVLIRVRHFLRRRGNSSYILFF